MKNNLPEKFRKRKNFSDDYSLVQEKLDKETLRELEIKQEKFVGMYSDFDRYPSVIFCTDFLVDLRKAPADRIALKCIESVSPAVVNSGTSTDFKIAADAISFAMSDGSVRYVLFPGTEGFSRDAFEVVNLIYILQRRQRSSNL